MTKTMRVLAAAAVALGVSAAAPQEPTLTFESTTSNSEQTRLSATGGAGMIDFTGGVQTPNACYDTAATMDAGTSTVTVTVTSTARAEGCTQAIAYQNYTGQVSLLQPGTYRFRLVHTVGTASATVYDERVTVS